METKQHECICLRAQGLTYEEIGERLGISRQRVHQILMGYRSASTCCKGRRRRTKHSTTEQDRKKSCEYSRRYRQSFKFIVLAHYSLGEIPQCVKCGFTDIRALSIDHINGGGGKHKASLGIKASSFYRWLITSGYPEGYQTLCMNCQWIKKFKNKEHKGWSFSEA